MKAVRVQYTVNEGFAEQNKANIRAVMEELRGLDDPGVKYAAYVQEDGRTFTHVVLMRDGAEGVVGGLEAFGRFRAALKENVEAPPQNVSWEYVGSNFDA